MYKSDEYRIYFSDEYIKEHADRDTKSFIAAFDYIGQNENGEYTGHNYVSVPAGLNTVYVRDAIKIIKEIYGENINLINICYMRKCEFCDIYDFIRKLIRKRPYIDFTGDPETDRVLIEKTDAVFEKEVKFNNRIRRFTDKFRKGEK